MGFTLIHLDDCETAGNWTLVRRTLDLQSFGVNLVDLAPGEQIPEHDETKRDQEELFYIVGGSPTLVVDGEDHRVRAGTFARLPRPTAHRGACPRRQPSASVDRHGRATTPARRSRPA